MNKIRKLKKNKRIIWGKDVGSISNKNSIPANRCYYLNKKSYYSLVCCNL